MRCRMLGKRQAQRLRQTAACRGRLGQAMPVRSCSFCSLVCMLCSDESIPAFLPFQVHVEKVTLAKCCTLIYAAATANEAWLVKWDSHSFVNINMSWMMVGCRQPSREFWCRIAPSSRCCASPAHGVHSGLALLCDCIGANPVSMVWMLLKVPVWTGHQIHNLEDSRCA